MSLLLRPSLIEIEPQSIRPMALPDHVYAVLKQKILSCAIPPNQRLIEKNLCEELQVSRTPLREALNRLSHEELVSFRPHAGYRVAAITIAGFRDLIELRAIVEPEAAGLAALRATPADILELRAHAPQPHDPGDDKTVIEYCRANARFHLSVVRCARNSMLENIVMSSLDMYQRPTYLRIVQRTDPSNSTAGHRTIAEAIERRDEAAAREAMRRHVADGGARLLEALKAANYP